MIRASFLALMICASPACAGDSVDFMMELLAPEVMIPTVFEIEDIRPLWMTAEAWADQGVTQDMLWEYFDGEDLPAPVPLPGGVVLLLSSLALLPLFRRKS